MVVSLVSRTALVSSSTNSGTPSARVMIGSILSAGSVLSPLNLDTIASTATRPRRLIVSRVT